MWHRTSMKTFAVLGLVAVAASVSRAAVVYRSVADLTAEAEQIVIGDVIEVISYWDTATDTIRSRIVVQVSQYLVGSGSGVEVLEMSGGTVGEVSLHVSVLPVFEVGDHVLLFLGASEIRLVGCYQGAYLTDGALVGRMGPGCQRLIAETLQPLPQLLAEIQRALPPGTTLPEPVPHQGNKRLNAEVRYQTCGYSWAYQANPMGEVYKINANCADSSAGDAASQRTQLQNGAAAWNGAGAEYLFTYGGESTQTSVTLNGTNLIYFDTTPPDGGGYVAATYIWRTGSNISECDLVFNDQSYTWWNGSGTCGGNKMDIWNVATHEFGHFLCLLDLYGGGDTQKTMYGYVDYCETLKRTLHSDDIAGIIGIYGNVDLAAPTPNPMTWELVPYATGTSTIAMRASVATDSQNPPVNYEFAFVDGGPGGDSSAWQAGRDYADSGLATNTAYTYRVRARDSANTPNATGYSVDGTAYTLASVPGTPSVGGATANTLSVDVNPADNPASTAFAIRCAATVDPAWNGQYVDAGGNPSSTAVWRTDAEWGATTVNGLDAATEYCFDVRARNGDGIETTFSAQACGTTLAGGLIGDLNCNGAVGFDDINAFVQYVSNCATWQAAYPGCPPTNGDINENGLHACNGYPFDDINAFVNLLSGG